MPRRYVRSKGGRDDGERWLVQHPGHTDANKHPEQVEDPRRLHLGPGQQEQAPRQGAEGHDAAAAVTINPGADGQRHDPCAEQAKRQGAIQQGTRPPETLLHRDDKEGEGIKQGAPGDDLGHRHGPDHHPRARLIRVQSDTVPYTHDGHREIVPHRACSMGSLNASMDKV